MSSWSFIACPLLLLSSCQAPSSVDSNVSSVKLRNKPWVLQQMDGEPVTTAVHGAPYLMLRADELKAEGHGGCNRFGGPFTLPGPGQLRLGPLLSTGMGCDALMEETTFFNALENTRTYRIGGDTLYLFTEQQNKPSVVLYAVATR